MLVVVLSFIYSAAFSTLLLNGSVFHYFTLVFCSYSSFYININIYIYIYICVCVCYIFINVDFVIDR
jgi:hypothetical protein